VVTERELAEAHAFARRRLVQAYVLGRDVEPPPAGRAVLAGLVLAALLVAGAALLARIETSTAEDRPDPRPVTPAYPRAGPVGSSWWVSITPTAGRPAPGALRDAAACPRLLPGPRPTGVPGPAEARGDR